MRLVDQWRRILAALPERWGEARLALRPRDASKRARAAALLGPASPGEMEEELTFSVGRSGGRGIGPEGVSKLVAKLDAEGIRGTLRLVESVEPAPRQQAAPREKLADAWARAVATLPADWSDLYCELELFSSDHLDGAALLTAPLNPTRDPGKRAFRFRVAHNFGYGASPEMAARCLARLDEVGIPGRVRILRALSDTHNVDTQGPVWRVGGKAV
jgi:hypothetical protein